MAPGFLQGLGSGSSLEGLGFKVWGFRVEFVGFGFQGLGFPGFVWRVWAPRFRVSGFRLAGLVSKVSGLAPVFLQGLGLAPGVPPGVWAPRFGFRLGGLGSTVYRLRV